jgi:hypothetical protein
MMNTSGESVRNYYRRQGAVAVVDRILQDLQKDALLQMTWSVQDFEYITRIVEGALEPIQVRPNN